MRLENPGLDFELAKTQEWLETNGLGGFASSTVLGMNTRRYHGLLTAALRPPVERTVLLSKMEERLVVNGEVYELSVNQYPGALHPKGHHYLQEFRLDPFPSFVYAAGGVRIQKSVFLVYGENTVVIEYELLDGNAASLEVVPLVAFRDYHSLTHRNDSLNNQVTLFDARATIAPYPNMPPLHFAHNARSARAESNWYFNLEYPMEQERGLDFREDLFNPFRLTFELGAGKTAIVVASLVEHTADEAYALREAELQRRASIKSKAPVQEEFVEVLSIAAHQFLVKRGDLETIIAGYHWFTDWGRDTMISLPGLALVTGNHQAAKDILLAFAKSVDRGMLPNRFPDTGEVPEYNTVDATLWFFEAIAALLRYTGDYDFVKEHLFATLVDIFEWHQRGTRYGIGMNEWGLLECGEPGTQLTWMDAKIGDYVVTPRMGMPVEIQALWYNALCFLSHLSRVFDRPEFSTVTEEIATRAKRSFGEMFWNHSTGCLYDVVTRQGGEKSIRPNQILAGSLTFPILSATRMRLVLEVVERELLTPKGLRSLARSETGYQGKCTGHQWQRDTAYHQGTVWSWLIGPFVTAFMRAHCYSSEAKVRASAWIENFREHFHEAGLNQVSEIFDGEPPHTPRGCIAQAWSVAEILRASVEDLAGLRPELDIAGPVAAGS